MGRVPKDYDVATSARPEDVLRLFPRSQKVGVAFGVVIVRQGKAQVEVATFRSDGVYADGRRPESVTFTTPEIDAQRRDFTCNGIFFDPVSETLHDFVGGQADIAAKRLRAIGDPAHRFAEDHLRMIRAVRFAAKLGFEIETDTFAAIQRMAEKIRLISRERIGEELRMILEHPARAMGVMLLRKSGLLERIWPAELYDTGVGEFLLLKSELPLGRAAGIVAIQFAMKTAADPERAAESLRQAFMLSNDETNDVAWLLKKSQHVRDVPIFSRSRFKRLLADPRWETLWRLWREVSDPAWVVDVERRVAEMRAEGVAPPAWVTGDDLIRLGAPPGKQFKGWLETLYDRQLENEFADREAALRAARDLVNRGG